MFIELKALCSKNKFNGLFYCFILQVLPPPNVTGALHIGHALTAAIEVPYDAFRYSFFLLFYTTVRTFSFKLCRMPLFDGGECPDTTPCGFLGQTMRG